MSGPAHAGSALVAHHDETARHALIGHLEELHIRAEGAANRKVALGLLEERGVDLVILSPRLDEEPVVEVVAAMADRYPDVHLVVIAADDPAITVDALRAGATDVLHDAASRAELERVLAKVLSSVERIEGPAHQVSPDGPLVGETPAMQALKDKIARAASTDATVLIRGESGTGKELVAQRVHDASPRKHGPFIKVHCAALPEALLEAELFGHVRGAFTGATGDKPGRVALAEGGTLFLDEIGDVPLPMQVKLLRLLQERQYEALGDGKPRHADVRFVTATHRDLESMVKRGEFREDLFYRLNVVPLWVPPLRTRRGDVAILANRFVARFSNAHGRQVSLDEGALATLKSHRWPGNVRQLQNLVERLVVLSDREVIDEATVRRELESERRMTERQPSEVDPAGAHASRTPVHTRSEIVVSRTSLSGEIVPLSESLMKAERAALERALSRTNGNRTLAAKLLGVSRGTLYNKLEAHGLR